MDGNIPGTCIACLRGMTWHSLRRSSASWIHCRTITSALSRSTQDNSQRGDWGESFKGTCYYSHIHGRGGAAVSGVGATKDEKSTRVINGDVLFVRCASGDEEGYLCTRTLQESSQVKWGTWAATPEKVIPSGQSVRRLSSSPSSFEFDTAEGRFIWGKLLPLFDS